MRDARELDPQHNRIAQLTEEVETLRLVIAQGQQLHAADETRIRVLDAEAAQYYELNIALEQTLTDKEDINAKLKAALRLIIDLPPIHERDRREIAREALAAIRVEK